MAKMLILPVVFLAIVAVSIALLLTPPSMALIDDDQPILGGLLTEGDFLKLLIIFSSAAEIVSMIAIFVNTKSTFKRKRKK